MDNNKKAVIEKRIMRTGEKLKKNNMEFYYAETSADIRKIVKSLISEGDVITNGGTMTMQECGLYDMLSSPEYNYIDRSKVAPEEVRDVYIKAFSADVYITVQMLSPRTVYFIMLTATAIVSRLLLSDRNP